MDVLRSNADPRSEAFQANRAGFLEQIGYLNEQLALLRVAGGEKYVERHLARGKLMARERIELLLDRDSPFLEIAPLAAWGTDFGLGGGIISGIGVVSGVECVITANEPTMKGGTLNGSGRGGNAGGGAGRGQGNRRPAATSAPSHAPAKPGAGAPRSASKPAAPRPAAKPAASNAPRRTSALTSGRGGQGR